MDLNLTGAIVTNVSLISPSKTDYVPIISQVITMLLTAIVTLGGVYLNQHLNEESEKKKSEKEERKKRFENQKVAYENFLDIFSKTFLVESDNLKNFLECSSNYLRTALSAAEFGNITLSDPIQIRIFNEDKTIRSLTDIINIILKLRYENAEYGIIVRIEGFEAVRRIAFENMSPLLLRYLTEKGG
jgi:hypothetical protein